MQSIANHIASRVLQETDDGPSSVALHMEQVAARRDASPLLIRRTTGTHKAFS